MLGSLPPSPGELKLLPEGAKSLEIAWKFPIAIDLKQKKKKLQQQESERALLVSGGEAQWEGDRTAWERQTETERSGTQTRPRSPTTMSQPSLSQLDPFEGTRVLTAGLGKATTAEVAQIVADLGGQHLRTCLASKPPHVLIANDVKSEKYIECLSIAKTPVLKVEWIHACAKARRQLPYSGFRVPALSGLTICVTGVDQSRRPALQATVESAGGTYTKDLIPKVTHLIAVSTKSEKYEMACTWPKTRVVSLNWLLDSVRAKTRQNETKYPVQTTTTTAAAAAGGAVAGGAHERSSSHAASTAPRGAQGSERKGRHILKGQSLVSTVTSLSLTSLRLYCLGMDASELKRAKVLTRLLNAARFESFDASVTHVVMGRGQGRLAEDEVLAVRDHVTSGPGALVDIDWLEECHTHRAVVTHDAAPGAMVHRMERRLRGGKEDRSATSVGAGRAARGSARAKGGGVFAGKAFACHGMGSGETEEAKAMVARGGGTWVEPSGSKKDADFVVFPPSCGSLPRQVPAAARVTAHWVRASLETGAMAPPDDSILHRPLPYATPLASFADVTLCCSNYSSEERRLLYTLIAILGGKHDDSLRRSTTTHLVTPEAQGQKYDKCRKWGVRTVTAQWLLDSAKKGKLVGEGGYKPKAVRARGRGEAPASQGGHGGARQRRSSSMTAGSKRVPGLDQVLSKKVVFHKTEVRTKSGSREEMPTSVLEPLNSNYRPPSPQKHRARASYSQRQAREHPKRSPARSEGGKSSSAVVAAASPGHQTRDDVISAIDKIEGLFQNNPAAPGKPSALTRQRTRSRAQVENLDISKISDDLEEGREGDEGGDHFESSQPAVTYGSERGKIRAMAAGQVKVASAKDAKMAKRLLCQAVTSTKRTKRKTDDQLKDFGLIT